MAIDKEQITHLIQICQSSDWVSNKHSAPQMVQLEHIAYQEWASYRTERCLEAMDKGTPLPPVKLVFFELNDEPRVYDVSDCNHRCAARAKRQFADISAEISGGYQIDTSTLFIWQRMVWKDNGEDSDCLSCVWLDDELIQGIEALGVRNRDKHANFGNSQSEIQ